MHAAIRDTPANRDLAQGWVETRLLLVLDAVEALATVIAHAPVPLDGSAVLARVADGAQSDVRAFLDASGGQ